MQISVIARVILITLVVCLACGGGANALGQDTLQVTYVGNTGFLVRAKEGKIVIDGLLGSRGAEYYDMPSDSIVALMKSARPPFDNIGIIAVTHWHDDHFDAAVVAQHMTHDLHAVLLCPRQVADRLAAEPEFAQLQPRIRVIDSPIDSVQVMTVAGLKVRVLSSKHGSYHDVDSAGNTFDIHRDVRNLEYLFSFGEKTVFHSGDAAMPDRYRYRLLGLGLDSIDIAFVQAWSCGDLPSFREILVREGLLPRYIFFTHMAPGRAARLVADSGCPGYRGVTIATRQLQSWSIPAARR